jgi:hypothetical protein
MRKIVVNYDRLPFTVVAKTNDVASFFVERFGEEDLLE